MSDIATIHNVSPEDADLLDWAWSARKAKYKRYFKRTPHGRGSHKTHREQKTIYLHRVIGARIMGRQLIRLDIIDHIDRNTLNNKRDNLRIGNQLLNQSNCSYSNKYRGTTRLPNGKWRAQTVFLGKMYYLGTFEDRELAARAVENKRNELQPLLNEHIKTPVK